MTDQNASPAHETPAAFLPRMGRRLRGLLSRAEVDRAVFFALLTRAWQLFAGPVTLLLIVRQFSQEEQGFYYTFASLVALQSFVELGLYLVIINIASHEWAQLSLDHAGRIVGDSDAASRLVSLGRLCFKWYGVAGIIFVVGVGIAGAIFFSQAPHPGIQWQVPWWSLVVLNGFLLWTIPFSSILEGCNQVVALNGFRLGQSIVGSLALWVMIALGGGLWATVVVAGVNLLCVLLLILILYRNFFALFLCPPTGACFHWRNEIMPMQWRLALSGLANYFAFGLFNPVMFHYQGAAIAGQMGVTWQVVSTLQSGAMAWLQPKVSRFGVLIAKREFAALDQLWFRVSRVSFVLLACGAMVAWLLVYGLNALQMPLSQRLLGPLATGLLLLAALLVHISYCQSTYLRAHKREPIAVASVTSALMIGVAVWWLGSRFGPVGAASGYLFVVALYLIPYETLIWRRCRVEWHQPGEIQQ